MENVDLKAKIKSEFNKFVSLFEKTYKTIKQLNYVVVCSQISDARRSVSASFINEYPDVDKSLIVIRQYFLLIEKIEEILKDNGFVLTKKISSYENYNFALSPKKEELVLRDIVFSVKIIEEYHQAIEEYLRKSLELQIDSCIENQFRRFVFVFDQICTRVKEEYEINISDFIARDRKNIDNNFVKNSDINRRLLAVKQYIGLICKIEDVLEKQNHGVKKKIVLYKNYNNTIPYPQSKEFVLDDISDSVEKINSYLQQNFSTYLAIPDFQSNK